MRDKAVHHYKVVEPISYQGRKISRGQIIRFRESTAAKYVATGTLIKADPKYADVIAYGLKLPETVYILGSGPNAKYGWDRIHGFTIGLNLAIQAPVPIQIWGAMDPTLKNDGWFIKELDSVRLSGNDIGPHMIGKADYPIPVMDLKRIAHHFPWVRCVFHLDRPTMMSPSDTEPLSDRIRPGCTVAGAMIQICYHSGVKHIVLCGIDMFGSVYFDGSLHKKPERAGKNWSSVPIFNALMRTLEKKGMRFSTLTDTALDVKHIEDARVVVPKSIAG